jgi:precorrin-2/cobalt-factor-2 C20-methyltransferase
VTNEAQRLGKLYGVGVGPGAPDLVTLRAISVLRRCPVLALPRSTDFGASVAWSIVRDHVEGVEGQERLPLTFPMSKEPDRVRPFVERAAQTIVAHLRDGKDVAFVTEGDASLFSTFGYVRALASDAIPGLDVEVVPAVSSVLAVPAVAGIPLADGQQRIAIIPATYGVEDLVDLLGRFDTVVLMKLGGEMPTIIDALTRTGLLDNAVYVAKATMTQQRIVRDLRDVGTERGDCFAMVIVTRGDRAGVLLGRNSEGVGS